MSERRGSSPSSSNGLRHVLSGGLNRTIRSKHSGEAGDRTSIASDGSESHHGIRHSIESAIDKLKHGDGEDDDDHGLKKLVPSRIKSKRRRRKEEKEGNKYGEDAARGRIISERGYLDNDQGSYTAGDVDGSSLITVESETESFSAASPPPLVSHESHIGYLTTSSPLVKATNIPQVSSVDELQSESHSTPSLLVNSAKLASTESIQSQRTASLQAPSDSSKKRSPSPVGRIREALVRRGSDKINTSPERKPSAGGLGIGFKENGTANTDKRRSSVSSRIGAIFPVKQGAPEVNTSAAASPERFPAGHPQRIVTTIRPSTPDNSETQAPLIVNTPPTPTDPGLPRFTDSPTKIVVDSPAPANPNVVTSPSGNMISHRRARTNSSTLGPSKLSNITSAPLTPTLENGSTTPGQTGFFSTVFSAAQNAANTLTSSISNTSLANKEGRSRSSTQDSKIAEDVEVESVGDTKRNGEPMEEKELAVKTLGQGDLSLSHLGISETPSAASTPVTSKFPDEQRGRTEIKDVPSAGISRAQTHGVLSDTVAAGDFEEPASIARPRSMYEASNAGDRTPPNGSIFEDKTGIARSSSIRSAIGGTSRRKRNSSAATGMTIGAAIAAANTSIANPTSGQPKLTGFAVASKKRNRDFHALFRSVPEDDYLIEDYSCALQREILAHGRLYVSEGHLCFSSNIFGWVTTLVMSFDEIVSVEKRSTALLFKNGLEISTLHAKNIFASFTSRDSTYDLIVGIWKLGHPSLRSSLNGVRIDETGGDRTEKDDGNDANDNGSESVSGSDEESDDGEDVYDEDDEDDEAMSYDQTAEISVAGSDIGVEKTAASRKPSTAVETTKTTTVDKTKVTTPGSPVVDFPGPLAHGPTDCGDQDSHFEKVIADEIIPAPLGKVFNLTFGPASGAFMSKWLTNEQKCLDLQWEDRKGLDNEHKTRGYTYIKPLNGSIGPKQTKCLTTENLEFLDLEKSVSLLLSTQTPDVPSGNVFSVKTRYCMSWAENNSTRFQANCTIEWTGKSWLKGPIEKGANDGQVQYAKDIVAALKSAVSSRPRAATSSSGAAKGKKKGRKGASKSSKTATSGSAKSVPKSTEDWGLFEPVRPILGPVASIFQPLLSGNMVYGLLVGLLVAAWFGWGRGTSGRSDMAFYSTPERIAAYEEIWRREESELWEWLEERVGMDRLSSNAANVGQRFRAAEARNIEEKLRSEKVSEREIEIALKVTEEKLKILKGVVGKGKEEQPAIVAQGESAKERETGS